MYKLKVAVENGFPGHAYLLLSKFDASTEKRIEFGSVMAGKKYSHLSSTFSKAASLAAYSCAVTAYAFMPLVASGINGLPSALGLTLSIASLTYAAIYTPSHGQVIIQEQNKCSTSQANIIANFTISDKQAETLIDTANNHDSLYNLGAFNCVGFCKKMLRSIGLEMNKSIINTPATFRKKTSKMCPAIT